ncbi:MAG: ferredoxin [Coriobacteriia bacterium]|nr:ferredoxin [Coriobacteriia bacterium]
MKAVVDHDLCTGCGVCEQTCPEVFRIAENGLAYVIDEDPPAETYPDIEGSAELCPVAAISVTSA